jgi:hypothetical protein
MITIVFYVMLCTDIGTAKEECNTFQPYSWEVSTEAERTKAFEECSILVNSYDQLEATKETDCYVNASLKHNKIFSIKACPYDGLFLLLPFPIL